MPSPTLQHPLRLARIIWAGYVLGVAIFTGAILALVLVGLPDGGGRQGDASLLRYPLLIASGVLLLIFTVMGYFFRNQCYKAYWREHAVAPPGYIHGNVLIWSMLASPALLAMVGVVVTGSTVPTPVAVASLVLLAINFPTGKPLRPQPPNFAIPAESSDV